METTFPDWARGMRVATWQLGLRDLEMDAAAADRRAAGLAALGVDAVVSFGCHFRWDWIARFADIREATRRAVEACHRHGIRYIEHHSAVFVTRLRERTPAEFAHLAHHLPDHTVPEPPGLEDEVRYAGERLDDWFVIDAASGAPDYWQGYRARALCPNHPGYQRRYLDYLADLLGGSGADGIMSDDVTMGTSLTACACAACQALFRERTGLAFPGAAGLLAWQRAQAPEAALWREFRAASVREHYRRIAALIVRLGRPLLHASCATNLTPPAAADLYHRQAHHNATFMEVMQCLHLHYSWRTVVPELRTWRALARAGGNPSFAIAYPLAQGGEAAFAGALLRMEDHAPWLAANIRERGDGGVAPTAPAGQWYPWDAAHRRLFDTAAGTARVAVLFSDASRRRYRGVHRDHYTYEFVGWCQALQAAGIDYDVVVDGDLGALPRWRLLAAPNAACLDDAQCAALDAFVAGGGRLIASHEASLYDGEGRRRPDFALACLGLSWRRTVADEHWPLQARGGDDGVLRGVRGLVPHRQPAVEAAPLPGTAVLATAYTDGGGLQGGSVPAVTRRPHGAGEALWLAGKPGLLSYLAEARWNSWDGEEPDRILDQRVPEWGAVIGNAVRLLAGRLAVELTGARAGVACRAYRLRDGALAVHLLNGAGGLAPHGSLVPARYAVEPPPPEAGAAGLALVLDLGRPLRARLHSPDREAALELAVSAQDGAWALAIPAGSWRTYAVVEVATANQGS